MNDQTTVAQYLQSFVDADKASSKQATAVNEIFTQNWLNTLGDIKNFTATELGNLSISAGLIKDLEAKNFLKPGNNFVTQLLGTWNSVYIGASSVCMVE